jgi:hypothetical protein
MTTTLNKIKTHSPCENGWNKLLNHLGKTQADDEPLSIATIIQSNGIIDAVWALCAVEGKDKEIRLFAADCAESVLHIYENKYPNDDRPRKAIQAARNYANGVITLKELAAARDAAWDAARDAAGDAGYAARAARGAAWDAARAAGAARGAAWDAAWAARAAAWDARDAFDAKWQEIEILLIKYL